MKERLVLLGAAAFVHTASAIQTVSPTLAPTGSPTTLSPTLAPTGSPTLANPESRATNTVIGVSCILIAVCFASLGNVLMKYTHNKNQAKPKEQQTPSYKRPMWYFIFFLMAGNGIFDFIGYSFADLSVLAPLSSLTIAANGIIARIILKERFGPLHICGSLLTILGSFFAVYSWPSDSSQDISSLKASEVKNYFTRPLFIYYAVIKNFLIILSMFVVWSPAKMSAWLRQNCPCWGTPAKKIPKQSINKYDSVDQGSPLLPASELNSSGTSSACYFWKMFNFAFFTSGIGSWTNQTGKAGVTLIKTSITSQNQMHDWLTWVLVIGTPLLALVQLKAMAAMMNTFPAGDIIPMFQVVFMLQLIMCGAFFFNEFNGQSSFFKNEFWLFVGSVLCCCLGIFIISFDRTKRTSSDIADKDPHGESSAPSGQTGYNDF